MTGGGGGKYSHGNQDGRRPLQKCGKLGLEYIATVINKSAKKWKEIAWNTVRAVTTYLHKIPQWVHELIDWLPSCLIFCVADCGAVVGEDGAEGLGGRHPANCLRCHREDHMSGKQSLSTCSFPAANPRVRLLVRNFYRSYLSTCFHIRDFHREIRN